MSLPAKYRRGTYRVVSPDETLKRVAPYLSVCGITRCASVTRLDIIGIHVCCAMRPKALTLQVSNGKGLTEPAAQASSIMEALELYHAENPPAERLRRTCVEELRAEGAELLLPSEINEFRDTYFTGCFRCDWIKGKELFSDRPVWAPASAVYFGCRPTFHTTTTNGLASGNHLTEAVLHALYELLERDAVSRLSVNGKLKIREHCSIVDTSTVDDDELRDILDKVAATDTKVVLLRVESCVVKVPTFWALFLDRASTVAGSTLNVGWGTHIDLRVAAARAITEAAQSRLTFIHGAREDALIKPVYRAKDVPSSPAFRFFDRLEPTETWRSIKERETLPVTTDLERCLDRLLLELNRAGHDRLVLFDLTRPDVGIPVVKILAPSLLFNKKLF